MTQNQQTRSNAPRKGGPGALSRWIQRRANARTCTRIRRKGGAMMGMEVLILHTVGRRSGEPRESPVAWFDDGEHGWLIVGSGGGSRNPDWCLNLMANPDQAAVELHGSTPVPVTPHRLDAADREKAWQHIAAVQPRIAKYQGKSEREYPVIRLSPRQQMETR
ncbi:nitroreductase family deazaflavin-dependent oxidoreductase [Georgenia halophila]|uniref:Nitroreductase family deazaflavin-dependent oxidoreductase n=1 Tax=Georgenia halophila TaxID=620889 RepID=A0ABP8LA17_9MICO